MSTLSGVSAKGEKGKSKFQSLDINNLYRASRGESLETNQHKNTSSRRHGMQTLGKIPSARRPPANLPSLKSEYSGNDPAINLVPTGGTGWGSKPGETGPPPPMPSTQAQVSTSTTPTPPVVSNPPVTTVSVSTSVSTATVANTPSIITQPAPVHSDKSWSSVTSSSTEAPPIFLAHQSPYFQQEFPSLSGDAGGATGSGQNKTDASHLPGPSLRPQTEGSWMQGGSRPQGQMAAGVGSQQGTVPAPAPLHHLPQGLDVSGGRNNLAPSGGGVGLAGHMPPAGMPPHHYRLMPQFMIRHNHPSGGFPINSHGPPRLRFPYPPDARMMGTNRGSSSVDQEEITSRPIIKEEDLKVMDEISRDTGWAAHDEIDYNQTLSFSDEEGAQDDKLKAKHFRQTSHIHEKRDSDSKISEKGRNSVGSDEKLDREESSQEITPQDENREAQRPWHQSRSADVRQSVPPLQPARVTNHQSGRQGEDDDVWRERRRLQHEEIAIAVERAKQRKEEEEKRYEETRQAAARKLQMLEEKMRSKTNTDKEEVITTLPVQHVPSVLLPDWEKEKSKQIEREDKDDKPTKDLSDSYNNAQMESKSSFNRDKERDRDRDLRQERETSAQPSTRHFQNNLPPRFQRQVTERPSSYYRQSSGGSPQPSSGVQPLFDNRWQTNTQFGANSNSTKTQRNRNDSDISDRDREDSKDNRESDKSTVDVGFDTRDKERYNPSSKNIRENSWKSAVYCEETGHNRISSENEHLYEYDNRKYEKYVENDDYTKEKNKDNRLQEEVTETEKKPYENFRNIQISQEDVFGLSEKENRISQLELERRELRDRPERPQRPDSRDSRASRDSRTSRESNKEDNKIFEESDTALSWGDSNYETEHSENKVRPDGKEERDLRRDSHTLQTYHQRHIPGPITREKLEASELKCEASSSLVPLIRSDKKLESTKTDNQWEVGNTGRLVWQQQSVVPASEGGSTSDCWADLSGLKSSSEKSQPHENEASSIKTNSDDNGKSVSNTTVQPREELVMNRKSERGRGGNRGMRNDLRGSRQSWGPSFYRGNPAWRGADSRGRRAQHRKPNMGRDWGHSESEASADEISVSTESGKEDKRFDQDRRHFPRFSKQGFKKSDKDDKFKENLKPEGEKESRNLESERKHEKRPFYEDRSSGFEPRGEPSRRGRGAPFRSKGSATNVGRRMDGYGPPTSKRPFTSESTVAHEERKSEGFPHGNLLNKEDSLGKLSQDEKMKMNQQQLAAGIIGNARLGFKSQPSNVPPRMRRKSEGERRDRKGRDGFKKENKSTMKSGSASGGEQDENWETTSETSDREDKERDRERQQDTSRQSATNNNGSSRGQPRRQPQTNRNVIKEKRRGGSYDQDWEQNSRRSLNSSGPQSAVNGSVRASSGKASALLKEQGVVVIDDQPESSVEEDQRVFATDNNGFQEVRSKKNVKEANRQQKEERTKPGKSQSPGPSTVSQLSPAAGNKGSYDRSRPGKLPPRFAKLRETSRLQKMAQQDVNDLNKNSVGGSSVFSNKDLTSPAPPPPVNAWDKPITAALRTSTPPATGSITESCNVEPSEHVPANSMTSSQSQRSSPDGDKAVSKPSKELAEKAGLDGTSPPRQTMIFENTNFKSAPADAKSKYNSHMKSQRPERKLEEESMNLGFKSPVPDMKLPETKADPIQMPISFNKNEDNADMKLDFRFDSDLSLTEDKTTKNITAIQMTRSTQMTTQSSAAELQFKLASVKKVWENPPSALEHSKDETCVVSSATTFNPAFSNAVEDGSSYGKAGVDSSIVEDSASDGVYNSGQPLQSNPNSYSGNAVQNLIKPDPSSNVCKVKPQPQTALHPHSGPLSPPSGAFTSSSAQPSQHIGYQPPAQYGGIPAIPSPPTVFAPQGELYTTFHNPSVMGSHSQGRSQFSQFTSPYFSQNLSQTSGFGQQSMYHVQPVTAAPPPDVFSQLRMQAYGTSQQLNNPNTVLITSSTNSLMSASVKPSPQPIGTIGSKGASYQAPTQPPPSQPPMYIYQPDPQALLNPSPYIQNNQLVQRPTSNVVPTITPSSASFYSASTGGATSFYQPGNSSLQGAAPNMHQTAFGLQAFNTQSPAATPAGMGSFGSTLPRLILQNPMPPPPVGVVGSRVPQTPHRSSSPAPPRATASSPRFKQVSHTHRQHSS